MTRHCERESTTLGSYSSNAFRGSLDWRVAPKPGQPSQHFGVLVHEYWHYLHNISTLVGLRSFQADQALLNLFSRTLNRSSGESEGSACAEFRPEDRNDAIRIALLQRDAIGTKGPANRTNGRLESRVASVNGRTIEVEIHKEGRCVTNETFILGTLAIEESVAFEVEGLVCGAFGVQMPDAPEFPYRVLSRLLQFYVGDEVPPNIVAGLGTLALLAEHPEEAVSVLAQQYRTAQNRYSDSVRALRYAVDSVRVPFGRRVRWSSSNLQAIQEMHVGRGLSEKASRYVTSVYQKALERRACAPLFDIECFLSNDQTVEQHLESLFDDYPPCDFLVKRPDGEVDILSTEPDQPDEYGLALPQYMRAFDAQRAFMRAHLLQSGEFAASQLNTESCPFVGGCGHPLFKQDEVLCRTKPWRHIHSSTADAEGCWYTCGVQATRGLVKLTKVSWTKEDE